MAEQLGPSLKYVKRFLGSAALAATIMVPGIGHAQEEAHSDEIAEVSSSDLVAASPQEAPTSTVEAPESAPQSIKGFRMPLLFDSKLYTKDFDALNPYVYTEVGQMFDPLQFKGTFVKDENTPRGKKYSYKSAAAMDPGATPMYNTVTVNRDGIVVDESIYTVLSDGNTMIPYDNYKKQEWFSKPKFTYQGSSYHGNHFTLEVHEKGYAFWRDNRFVHQVFALPEITEDISSEDYLKRYQDLFQVGMTK